MQTFFYFQNILLMKNPRKVKCSEKLKRRRWSARRVWLRFTWLNFWKRERAAKVYNWFHKKPRQTWLTKLSDDWITNFSIPPLPNPVISHLCFALRSVPNLFIRQRSEQGRKRERKLMMTMLLRGNGIKQKENDGGLCSNCIFI